MRLPPRSQLITRASNVVLPQLVAPASFADIVTAMSLRPAGLDKRFGWRSRESSPQPARFLCRTSYMMRPSRSRVMILPFRIVAPTKLNVHHEKTIIGCRTLGRASLRDMSHFSLHLHPRHDQRFGLAHHTTPAVHGNHPYQNTTGAPFLEMSTIATGVVLQDLTQFFFAPTPRPLLFEKRVSI